MIGGPIVGKLHNVRAVGGRHVRDPQHFTAILVLNMEEATTAVKESPEMIGAAIVSKLYDVRVRVAKRLTSSKSIPNGFTRRKQNNAPGQEHHLPIFPVTEVSFDAMRLLKASLQRWLTPLSFSYFTYLIIIIMKYTWPKVGREPAYPVK